MIVMKMERFLFLGTEIICQARGSPFPSISWTKSDGTPIGTIPGLRQVNLGEDREVGGGLQIFLFGDIFKLIL